MRQVFLILAFLMIISPQLVLASTARSSVESQVQAGNVEIYQSVETTVNGETLRKESRVPGKLELNMEQTGNSSPIVTSTSASPSAQIVTKTSSSFAQPLVEFVRKLLSNLTSWFK